MEQHSEYAQFVRQEQCDPEAYAELSAIRKPSRATLRFGSDPDGMAGLTNSVRCESPETKRLKIAIQEQGLSVSLSLRPSE